MATKAKKKAAKTRIVHVAAKPAKKKSGKKRTRHAGYGGILGEFVKGAIGAVAVAKFGDMIPIKNDKARHAVLTAVSGVIAVKSPALRSVALGAGIASGTMLISDFVPNLMKKGTLDTNKINRLDPATVDRMRAAAEQMRRGINGNRLRTIVGGGNDFPQPVRGTGNQGYRMRTVVGSGDGIRY